MGTSQPGGMGFSPAPFPVLVVLNQYSGSGAGGPVPVQDDARTCSRCYAGPTDSCLWTAWAGTRITGVCWTQTDAMRPPCERSPRRRCLVRDGKTVQSGLEEKGNGESW